jgi:threonine/homoserine/homoserine lactone efflux protein
MNRSSKAFLLGALANLSVTMPAAAYVGPGAGITLIGAVIGLVSAIFLALFAVLRWPIRRYLARRKAARESAAAPSDKGPESGTP